MRTRTHPHRDARCFAVRKACAGYGRVRKWREQMAENDARPEALRSVAPSLKPPALARARTGLALRGVARHGPVHPYLPRYSVEEPRGSFIPNVTAHDLWETYLAQCAAVPAQPLGHTLAAWQLSARVCAWLMVPKPPTRCFAAAGTNHNMQHHTTNMQHHTTSNCAARRQVRAWVLCEGQRWHSSGPCHGHNVQVRSRPAQAWQALTPLSTDMHAQAYPLHSSILMRACAHRGDAARLLPMLHGSARPNQSGPRLAWRAWGSATPG